MKPMLAAKVELEEAQFPCFASPKLDGIRCLIKDGQVLSRSLKPIPNKHVQKLFGHRRLEGFDGELIVGDPTHEHAFNTTSSGVMSVEGEPDVGLYVFDLWNSEDVYVDRMSKLIERLNKLWNGRPAMQKLTRRVNLVNHFHIANREELESIQEDILGRGYEGVMLRREDGPYKFGRSTLREGYLLKLKQFVDAEARITGVRCMRTNENPPEEDNLGAMKRSHKKAGMKDTYMLGVIGVEDLKTGVKFDIGSGFTHEERVKLWEGKGFDLIGRIVKYKYQDAGMKDKPRFPVFLGFRDEKDLS